MLGGKETLQINFNINNLTIVTPRLLEKVNYWGWDMISYYREIPKRALVAKVQVPRNSGSKKKRDLHELQG